MKAHQIANSSNITCSHAFQSGVAIISIRVLLWQYPQDSSPNKVLNPYWKYTYYTIVSHANNDSYAAPSGGQVLYVACEVVLSVLRFSRGSFVVWYCIVLNVVTWVFVSVSKTISYNKIINYLLHR